MFRTTSVYTLRLVSGQELSFVTGQLVTPAIRASDIDLCAPANRVSHVGPVSGHVTETTWPPTVNASERVRAFASIFWKFPKYGGCRTTHHPR